MKLRYLLFLLVFFWAFTAVPVFAASNVSLTATADADIRESVPDYSVGNRELHLVKNASST